MNQLRIDARAGRVIPDDLRRLQVEASDPAASAWVAANAGIKRISNIEPDAARRTLARRLFAMALETPGGLKVQTIHAFCTRLLHHFTFEANVAARFDVLDEAAEAKLLGETSLAV